MKYYNYYYLYWSVYRVTLQAAEPLYPISVSEGQRNSVFQVLFNVICVRRFVEINWNAT